MPGTQYSWACVEHGKPLQKIEIPVPEPTGTEIVIRVTHCGVCHSDLHMWEGFYKLATGKRLIVKDRGVTLPRALGHEILGTVEKLGPQAEQVPLGSGRVVYPWVGCQKCRRCEDGDDNLCSAQRSLGVFTDGGFAQYVTVPHAKYLVDYGDVDPAVACTFGCSGLTVLSAIEKIMPLRSDGFILLVGAGGVGLSCIAMLRALGHDKIIVADIASDKREAALAAGASEVIDSSATTSAQADGRPIYSAIDFVGIRQTAEFAMASIAKGGRLVIVGIMGGDLTVDLVPLALTGKAVMGNITGAPRHLNEVVRLAKEGRLETIPVTKVPWNHADDALQRLNEGKVVGRLILVHGDDSNSSSAHTIV